VGSNECQFGEICIEGECVEEGNDPQSLCIDEDRCPAPQTCNVLGECEDPAECDNDDDCVSERCDEEAGVCVVCEFDEDCPGGQICMFGQACIEPEVCEDDLDCLGARVCVDDACEAGDCEADDLEDNNGPAEAAEIGAGVIRDLTICGQDEDWYQVRVPVGHGLNATIGFDPANGDVDLELFLADDPNAPIDISAEFGAPSETVTLDYAEEDTLVLVHVYTASPDVAATYDLAVELVAGLACEDDGFDEANAGNTQNEALFINAGLIFEGSICAGDVDWFVVRLAPGETVVADLLFDAALGELSLDLVDANGAIVQAGEDIDGGLSAQFTANVDGPVWVQIGGGEAAAVNNYDLSISKFMAGGLQECADALDAEPLEPGIEVHGDTSAAASGADHIATCNVSMDGADDVYRIHLDKPSVVTIRLETEEDWDAVMVLRDDCDAVGAEIACADDPEEIVALLEPGDYFIIVDAWNDDAGPYTLTWEIEDPICIPGERGCLGNLVAVCAEDGSGWIPIAECDGLCDEDGAVCVAGNDTCDEAEELEDGVAAEGSTVGVGDEYDTGCSDETAISGDLVYSFTLEERTGVKLTLTSDEGLMSVAVRSACRAPDSEMFCDFTAADPDLPSITTILDAGTYYVLVDGLGVEGEFELLYETFEFECDFFEETTRCHPEPDMDGWMQRCVVDFNREEVTVWEDALECEHGCQDGHCIVDNDMCADAEVLVPGALVSGSTIGAQNGGNPTCVLNFQGQGYGSEAADVWYRFEIPQEMGRMGVELRVEDSDFIGMLHVRTDCDQQASEVACAPPREGFFGFLPPSWSGPLDPGTYFVAVDGLLDFEGQFGLYFDLYDLVCDPGEPGQCSENLDTLLTCSPDGREIVELDCPNGCDAESGRCSVPNDTCESPQELIPGDVVEGRLAGAGDDYAGFACPWAGGAGPDLVYSFEVQEAQQVATLDLQGAGTDFLLYVRKTVCDQAFQEEVCVDDNNVNPPEATALGDGVRFVVTPGTYYVFVDAWPALPAGDMGEFTLTFSLEDAICEPGMTRCVEEGDPGIEACVGGLEWIMVQPCPGGCANGECVEEEGGTCDEPRPAEAGMVYEGSTADFQPNENASCAGGANGPEVVYQYTTGAEPEFVMLSLEGSGYDTALHVRTECENAGTEVICNDDSFGLQSYVEFPAEANTTYFIFVDGFGGGAGPYMLAVDAFPLACWPADRTCAAEGSALMECLEDGSDWIELVDCPFGCENEECLVPNDECDENDSRLIQDGEVLDGSTRFARNDYSGTCQVSNAGDTTFRFVLPAPLGVNIWLDAMFDGHFYVRSDCDDRGSEVACAEAGFEGSNWQGVLEAGTYYIIVDGADLEGFGDVEGEFSIGLEYYDPICDPGETHCEGSMLATCLEDGTDWDVFDCPGPCVEHDDGTASCLIDNDTCDSPEVLVAGQWATGDTRAGADDYELGCTHESGDDTEGDVVYQFEVPAGGEDGALMGALIRFEWPDGAEPPVIGIQEECGRRNTELACGLPAAGGMPTDIQLPLDAGTYYVIVDSLPQFGFGPGEFSIFFDLYEIPEGDQCALPFEIEVPELVDGMSQVMVEGDSDGFNDDYSSCVGGGSPDVVYSFVAPAGAVTAMFELTSPDGAAGYDTGLYARVADCEEGAQVGCNDDDGGTRRSSFEGEVVEGETYFVFVDGWGGQSGPYTLTLTFSEPFVPECDEGATQCDEFALGVEECVEGRWAFGYDCPEGCNPDTNDCVPECDEGESRCDEFGEGIEACVDGMWQFDVFCDFGCAELPDDGAMCLEPLDPCEFVVDLMPGEAGMGDTTDSEDRALGECGEGPEDLYQFTVEEFARVTLEVVPDGWDATLDVRAGACAGAVEVCDNTCRFNGDGDCDDGGPDSDYSLCEFGSDCDDCGPRLAGPETLECADDPELFQDLLEPGDYHALVTGFGGSVGPYTINLDVQVPDCFPGGTVECFEVEEGVFAPRVCNPETLEWDVGEPCALGCVNAACVPENDVCENAQPLESGVTVMGDTTGASNDYLGTCAFGPAADLVYSITLEAPVTGLRVWLEADYNAFYYIQTACGDRQSEIACGEPMELGGMAGNPWTYQLEAGEYFIVVDGWGNDPEMRRGQFELTAEAYEVVCEPHSTWCVGPRLATCNEDGTGATDLPCPFGCEEDDMGVGACSIENDTCEGAIDLMPGGWTTGDTRIARDDYGAGCVDPTGGDVVYSFSVPAVDEGAMGALFHFQWNEGQRAPLITVRGVCDDAATEVICGTPTDNMGNPMDLEFPLPAGDYSLIVDAAPQFGFGPDEFSFFFDLYEIAPGETCDLPAELEVPEYVDGVSMLTVEGSTAGMANDIDGSCFGGSGPDMIYALVAPPGVDFAEIEVVGDYDTHLSVRAGFCDLEEAEVACNDDDGWRRSYVELIPAVEGELYFIAVDGYGAGSAGNYTMNVTFHAIPVPDCVDGEQRCSEDLAGIEFCVGGFWGGEVMPCPIGCNIDTNECTPECEGDARECVVDDGAIRVCVEGFWELEMECPAGCTEDPVECTPECEADARECLVDDGVIRVCVGGFWELEAECPAGCTVDPLECTPQCEVDDTTCDEMMMAVLGCVDGFWGMDPVEVCEFGCAIAEDTGEAFCAVPPDPCDDLVVVEDGAHVESDLSLAEDMVESGCGNGPEELYGFTVAAESMVVIDVLPTPTEICDDTCFWPNDGACDDGGDGGMQFCALGSDCGDCGPREMPGFDAVLELNEGMCGEGMEMECLDDPEHFEGVLMPGEYHFMVSTFGGAGGEYTVDVQIQEAECFPPGLMECSDGEDGLGDGAVPRMCDEATLTWTYGDACAVGCVDGLCLPANDTCEEGVVALVSGEPVAGSTAAAAHEYSGGCAFGVAPDVVYSFTVPEDEVFVDVDVDFDFDGFFYVQSVCGDPATMDYCGTPAALGGMEGMHTFELEAGDYFLIVDGWGNNPETRSGEFELVVTTWEQDCVPDEQWCDDEDNLITCDSEGRGGDHLVIEPCEFGCDPVDVMCIIPEPPENDACEGAAMIPTDDGTVDLEGDTTWAANSYPGKGGLDVFYTFTLENPATLDILLTGPDGTDTYLYLLGGDCADGLVVEASSDDFGGDFFVSFIQDRTIAPGTYYIVPDAWGADDAGPFTLAVTFENLPLACTPDEVVCDDEDNLHTCNGLGTEDDLVACEFGCSAVNLECNPPPAPGNDLCADAVDLPVLDNASVAVAGYTTSADHDYMAGRESPDVWYTFTLQEDTQVTIEMETEVYWDTYLYLLSGACDALDELAGEDSASYGPEILGAGTYYIVATGWTDAHTGDFDLTVNFEDPPPVLDCATPGELVEGLNEGDTTGAPDDTAWPACASGFTDGLDEVWAFTAPCLGQATLTLDPSFDAVMGVYDTCVDGQIACSDDDPEAATIDIVDGEDYFVVVSGYSGGRGAYTLDLAVACDP